MPSSEQSTTRQDEALFAFSIAEVAKRLGVHQRTVWRYARYGLIRSVRFGRRRLIPARELAALLERRG